MQKSDIEKEQSISEVIKRLSSEKKSTAAAAAPDALALDADTDATKRDDDVGLIQQEILHIISQKLSGPKCDLWKFLASQCQYTSSEIWQYLWCGEDVSFEEEVQWKYPPRLEAWSLEVTANWLRRDSKYRCKCYMRYADRVDEQRYKQKSEACEHKHWIRGELFVADAEERPFRQRLKIAVDGFANMNKGQGFRVFGTSMFCAIFETPGGHPLMLRSGDKGKSYTLYEDRAPESTNAHNLMKSTAGSLSSKFADSVSDHNSFDEGVNPHLMLSYYCQHCEHNITPENNCNSPLCYWVPYINTNCTASNAHTERRVNRCSADHLWPNKRTSSCPHICDDGESCGKPALKSHKLQIYIQEA